MLNAEVIRQQTERLALLEGLAAQPSGVAHIEPPELPINNPDIHVQVPRPDLRQFNQLLTSGEPSYV